jgi:RimJ/RimL family protein N-acetyltransferase
MDKTMNWPKPVTLRGRHATLEPLTHEHCDALREATKDGELWKLWYTAVPKPEGMMVELDRRLDLQAEGSMLPFAVLDADGTAVGVTTFMNIDAANKRVEIGSTWYAQRVQRTALNTECKLMLMQHAFETLGCIAVEYRTSSFNKKSRRAIERLGAKLDGVLRNHQHHIDGSLRDTCVYSIIQSEWSTVKSHLTFLLEETNPGGQCPA